MQTYLSYFKCPGTKQMRCPVNAYKKITLPASHPVEEWIVKNIQMQYFFCIYFYQSKFISYYLKHKYYITARKLLRTACLTANKKWHPAFYCFKYE